MQLACEALEDRTVLSNMLWDPLPFGNIMYSDGQNWLNLDTQFRGIVPSGVDDIHFEGPHNIIVDVNAIVKTLTMHDGTEAGHNPWFGVMTVAADKDVIVTDGAKFFKGKVTNDANIKLSGNSELKAAFELTGTGNLYMENNGVTLINAGDVLLHNDVYVGNANAGAGTHVFEVVTQGVNATPVDMGMNKLTVRAAGELKFSGRLVPGQLSGGIVTNANNNQTLVNHGKITRSQIPELDDEPIEPSTMNLGFKVENRGKVELIWGNLQVKTGLDNVAAESELILRGGTKLIAENVTQTAGRIYTQVTVTSQQLFVRIATIDGAVTVSGGFFEMGRPVLGNPLLQYNAMGLLITGDWTQSGGTVSMHVWAIEWSAYQEVTSDAILAKNITFAANATLELFTHYEMSEDWLIGRVVQLFEASAANIQGNFGTFLGFDAGWEILPVTDTYVIRRVPLA